jgi:hypothetical protein
MQSGKEMYNQHLYTLCREQRSSVLCGNAAGHEVASHKIVIHKFCTDVNKLFIQIKYFNNNNTESPSAWKILQTKGN